MGLILTIARKYNLSVLEDAAEAHGALYKQKKVGSLGEMGCFSFYGNKIITTGEGGMIITNNKVLADKIKMLRDHGVSQKRKYYYPHLGFNYRMTNLQAALGLAQLKKIDYIINRKVEIAALYKKCLEPLVPKIILAPETSWAKNVFWMYSILVPRKYSKGSNRLISGLKKRGIDSRPFFFPCHRTPRYNCGDHLPVADFLAKSGLNLPSSVNLHDEQVKFICDSIKEILYEK